MVYQFKIQLTDVTKPSVRRQVIVPDRSIDVVRFKEVKWQTTNLTASAGPVSVDKIPQPHLHFSHLFNAYSKYFSKCVGSRGALFERPFKRKRIDNEYYLKQVILYIHNNPVHHGFCLHPVEYPWSSYLSCISLKPTKLKRELVMGWFDSEANFRDQHNNKLDIDDIENWLEL